MSDLPSKPWFWALLLAITAGSIYLNCSGTAQRWCANYCKPSGYWYDTGNGTCGCMEMKP